MCVQGDRTVLRECRPLLSVLPHGATISITAPSQLSQELFSTRGKGTLLYSGEKVNAIDCCCWLSYPPCPPIRDNTLHTPRTCVPFSVRSFRSRSHSYCFLLHLLDIR